MGTGEDILRQLSNFHPNVTKNHLKNRWKKKKKKNKGKKKVILEMSAVPSRSGLLPEKSETEYLLWNWSPSPSKRSPLPDLLEFHVYSGSTFCSFQNLLCIYVLGDGQAGLLVLSISNMLQRRIPVNFFFQWTQLFQWTLKLRAETLLIRHV